jgi:hypothetical protein
MSVAEGDSAAAAGPFSRTTIIAVLIAGVFSFSGLAVLSAYAPDLRRGSDGGAHALSKSAIGFAGLAKLLQAAGTPVVISRGEPPAGRTGAILVLTPDETDDAADIARIHFQGPTLIAPPKWMVMPLRQNPEWVEKVGGFRDDRVSRNLIGKLSPGARLEARKGVSTVRVSTVGGQVLGEARIDSARSLAGSRWTPVLVDEAGAVLMARQGNKYLLAEPDLLNTQALKTLKGATLASGVVERLGPKGTPVFFDVTLNGFQRSRSLLRLAFEPPFLAATLCAVAAALLMGLHAAVRFGAVRREDRALALGKTALADNQAALIRMARREHRMAEPYALQIRDSVARAVGGSRGPGGEDLESWLDRMGRRRSEQSISALVEEARAAADPAALMSVARRLFQWRTDMTRR